jgi:hypothetical protein
MSSLVASAIVSAVADVVEGAGVSPVYERRLQAIDGQEGAVVRTGAQTTAALYIDGQADVRVPVRVLCKRRSATQAMTDAEKAWDAMDGMSLAVSGIPISIEPSGVPFELSIDESGFSVWEADAAAAYTTPKEG